MTNTIALFLPNWIGDLVMATPTIRTVRNTFPSAHLIGIMRPYVGECLTGTSWFDETLLYSPRGKGQLNRRHLVQQLRARRIERALLFPNSLSVAMLAWLGGARQRVGFSRYGRRFLLTDALRLPREGGRLQPRSAVDHYLELAQRIGCPLESKQLELAIAPEEAAAAERVWQKLGLIGSAPVIALSAGGAYGSAKRWPRQHCLELARAVTEHFDAKVLLLCGPAEREEAATIVATLGSPRVVSLAGEPPSIGLSKACLARCELLVTTDSGPRHIAAAVRCPTISLFGPTDPRWAHNYHSSDTPLSLALDCAPCAKRNCPLGHGACMRDLTPQRVFSAIRPLLESRSGLQRRSA